jgi:hypothetical protein
VNTVSQARLADPECTDKLPSPLNATTTATTANNAHTLLLPPVRTLLCGEPLPTALRPGCVACFQTQHPPENGSSLEITLQCSSSSDDSSNNSATRGSTLRLYVAQCAQQPLSLEAYTWQGVSPVLRVLPWCTDPAVRACPVWIAVAASKLQQHPSQQQQQQQQQHQQQQQVLPVTAVPVISAVAGASGSSEAAATGTSTTATAAAAATTAATAGAQDDNSVAAVEQRAMQLMREHKSAALKFTLGVRALAPPRLVRESTWTAVPFCTSPRAQGGIEVANGNVQAVDDLEHALPHVYMTLRLPSPMLQCAASASAAAVTSSGNSSSGVVAALTAAKGELPLQAFRDSEPVVRVQVRQL